MYSGSVIGFKAAVLTHVVANHAFATNLLKSSEIMGQIGRPYCTVLLWYSVQEMVCL